MKIAVLTSGGVDSSLVLQLLHNQGHDLTAFYLKIWLEDELSYLGSCPWQEDLSFVEQLCTKLGVPLKVVSLQQQYWDAVINLAMRQLQEGLTPNPDIFCNSLVKFGAFLDNLDDFYDKIATGHYAKVEVVDGVSVLQTAADSVKDQTYFLSGLTQEQLARAMFPLGDLTKAQVRTLAHEFDLPAQDRKDSQGLCFLGKISFPDFLKANLGERPGNLIEFETGLVVGRHNGFWFFTPGQRKGIGLSGGPWYVVTKDPVRNEVFISKQYHEPAKVRNQLYVDQILWNQNCPPVDQVNFLVKLRHGPEFYQATLSESQESTTRRLLVISGQDQGISPGQFVAFYQDGVCLGNAMIEP